MISAKEVSYINTIRIQSLTGTGPESGYTERHVPCEIGSTKRNGAGEYANLTYSSAIEAPDE